MYIRTSNEWLSCWLSESAHLMLVLEWIFGLLVLLSSKFMIQYLLLTPLVFKNYKQWSVVITDSIMLFILWKLTSYLEPSQTVMAFNFPKKNSYQSIPRERYYCSSRYWISKIISKLFNSVNASMIILFQRTCSTFNFSDLCKVTSVLNEPYIDCSTLKWNIIWFIN